MPDAASQLATYKALGACGVTLTAAIPPLLGMIEPATYADVEARLLYTIVSACSAGVVLVYYRPKDSKEALGRIMAAIVMAFAFVEPLAVKLRPYTATTALTDSAPLAAAFPAAVFLGICGWWAFGFMAFCVKSPQRVFRMVDWWRGRGTVQSIFEESGETPVTITNGTSQGQPGMGVTLIPSQKPTNTVQSGATASPESNTKTT